MGRPGGKLKSFPLLLDVDWKNNFCALSFGMAQMVWLGTSIMEFSSSKPLAYDKKRLTFWVEIMAGDLPSRVYLLCVVF